MLTANNRDVLLHYKTQLHSQFSNVSELGVTSNDLRGGLPRFWSTYGNPRYVSAVIETWRARIICARILLQDRINVGGPRLKSYPHNYYNIPNMLANRIKHLQRIILSITSNTAVLEWGTFFKYVFRVTKK